MITHEDISRAREDIKRMINGYEERHNITTREISTQFNGWSYIKEDSFLLFGYKSDGTVSMFEVRKTRAGKLTISCPTKSQVELSTSTLPYVYEDVDTHNKRVKEGIKRPA